MYGSFDVEAMENRPSMLEKTYSQVGESFEDVMYQMEQIEARGGEMTATDAMKLHSSLFKYTMYQELVSKVASKAAGAVNEVMKAQ